MLKDKRLSDYPLILLKHNKNKRQSVISPLLASIHGHDSDVLSLFLDFLVVLFSRFRMFSNFTRGFSSLSGLSQTLKTQKSYGLQVSRSTYINISLWGWLKIWYLRTSQWFNMVNHPFPREIGNFLRDMPHAPFSKTSILGFP